MKTISTMIQIAALAACFAAQFHPASVSGMPGTRKACTKSSEALPANVSIVTSIIGADGRARSIDEVDIAASRIVQPAQAAKPPASVCRNASPQAFARLRTRRM